MNWYDVGSGDITDLCMSLIRPWGYYIEVECRRKEKTYGDLHENFFP